MSGKWWALYASVHRPGTHAEHRLAGGRIGEVGATVTFSVPKGWKLRVHVGRFGLNATAALRRGDPRVADYLDFIMPPAIRETLHQGIDDIDSGRGYRWNPKDDGCHTPLATWRADDPQQPDGWHHDGTRWVLNDDGGWKRDRTGHWRYTKPGETGWLENPDGSWRYDDSPLER